ncbi:hypothetical protein CLAIMM_00005, partial [Cladophialophora immunda]
VEQEIEARAGVGMTKRLEPLGAASRAIRVFRVRGVFSSDTPQASDPGYQVWPTSIFDLFSSRHTQLAARSCQPRRTHGADPNSHSRTSPWQRTAAHSQRGTSVVRLELCSMPTAAEHDT